MSENSGPNASATGFLMPVVQTTLLPPIFGGYVSTFFNQLDAIGEEKQKIIGFRADYYAADQTTDHFVTDAILRIYEQSSPGDIATVDTEDLLPGNLQAFKDLLFGYHLRGADVCHTTAFNKLLPWNDYRFGKILWGTYHSFHIMRDFILLTREFMPLYAQDHATLIESHDVDLNYRKVFCTLIVPETSSAHEEIEQRARNADIAAQVSQLYTHLMDPEFFEEERLRTEVDFSNLEKLQT